MSKDLYSPIWQNWPEKPRFDLEPCQHLSPIEEDANAMQDAMNELRCEMYLSMRYIEGRDYVIDKHINYQQGTITYKARMVHDG